MTFSATCSLGSRSMTLRAFRNRAVQSDSLTQADFRLLHGVHADRRFSMALVPPAASGTMWSISSQVPSSRTGASPGRAS